MPRLPRPRHGFCLAILLLMLSGASGCAQFAAMSESMFMMSPDQEKEAGKTFAAQVEKEKKVVTDPQVVSYIQSLGQKIWANSGGGEIAPTYHVIEDPEINAFAIPGGDIYVQTGLIDAAEDEAELAGVIAHETGHVIMRHSARNVSRQQGFSMVQELLLGPDSGQATQLASSLLQSGVLNDFSRQDESQADEIGVKTLYNMGYDPLALRTFFNKLKDKYGDTSNPLAKLLSDHPPTQARMDAVSKMAAAFPNKPTNRPVSGLRTVQGRLKNMGL